MIWVLQQIIGRIDGRRNGVEKQGIRIEEAMKVVKGLMRIEG